MISHKYHLEKAVSPTALIIGGWAVETKILVDVALPSNGEFESKVVNSPGGSGWLASLTAVALGCKTTLLANIGNDAAGDFLRCQANRSGIVYDHQRSRKPTTTFLSVIQNSEPRYLFHSSNATNQPSRLLVAKHIKLQPDILVVCYASEDTIRRAGELRLKRTIKAVNIGKMVYSFTAKELLKILPSFDIIVLNQDEWSYLAQQLDVSPSQLCMLLSKGSTVFVTKGAKGAVGYARGSIVRHKLAQTRRVIDTTGAGDAFTVAAAVALRNNTGLVKALETASCAAAKMCALLPKSGLRRRAWSNCSQ